MSTLSNILDAQGIASAEDSQWLHTLLGDWQLLADLAFADIVLWIPTPDNSFIAAAHSRPSNSATLFYRDFVGEKIKPEWKTQVSEAFSSGHISESASPAWYEETPTRVRAVPVMRRSGTGHGSTLTGPIAVASLHTNLSENRMTSRQELTFNSCANDLFDMIAAGDFPDLEAAPAPRRGAPRANDGLLRLNVDGYITFASPNALSAFHRMGLTEELEGESLAEITASLVAGKQNVDESLPVVVGGRAPWRADISQTGMTISLRSIPTKLNGERTGAIVLSRDVTELRHQEMELITKDATIREIHHRVKNNLQTVASLLRIQARRTKSEEAREALSQAMRRVASIAVVHDTLSEGLSQNVNFDEVFQRVMTLTAEVAAINSTTVHPTFTGEFGTLPSSFATPLALALTELVTNAVEHGLAGREGTVEIAAQRLDDELTVNVRDNGVGLPQGELGDGLGTQIVRTLIEGELGGTINWLDVASGTDVHITIPLRFVSAELAEV